MTIAHLKTEFQRLPDWGWLLLIALSLRLFRLDAESLWFDEAGTAWISKLSFEHMIAAIRAYDVHPPLWYAIIWLIEHTLGNSEFLLRLPAAIFGTVAVLLLWRIAGQLGFERRTAFIVGVLAAVFPGMLYYSQEARMYPLLLCATLGAIWAVFSNRWAYFALFGLVIAYSQNLGLLYIVLLGGMSLLLRLPREWPLKLTNVVKAWRAPIIALVAIGIGWLFWAPSALYQINAVKRDFWGDPMSFVRFINPIIELTMGNRSSLAIDIGAYSAALGMTIVAVYFSRKWLTKQNGLLILTMMFGLPLIIGLITWLWAPIFLSRVMIVAMFLLALPWAYFLCHARKLDRRAAILIVVPMLATTLVAEYFPNRQGRDPVRAHMAPVLAAWQPGDVAYFTSYWTATYYEYYVDRPYAVIPDGGDGFYWHPALAGLGDLMELRQVDFDQLRNLGYKRVWLMTRLYDNSDPKEPGKIASILSDYPYHLFSYYRSEEGADISVYVVNLYPEF